MDLFKQITFIIGALIIIWLIGRIWFILYKVFTRVIFAIRYRTIKHPYRR